MLEPDNWCHGCGQQGVSRGTVIRRLAHVPLGWRPTTLQVRVRRYRCPDCRSVWRQDTSTAAEPRAVLSRHAALWALKGVVIDRLSVARIATGLAVAWNTANDAILATGQQLLINDPTRLDGVRVIGVDEYVWSHTRRGSKYVTVIIVIRPGNNGDSEATERTSLSCPKRSIPSSFVNEQCAWSATLSKPTLVPAAASSAASVTSSA
ncbi:transposase family protein [Brevibacterium sp. SMBL_HHYL_HB1]|nr:transposase family protein [Brevibacterium sp. SMBL_HHYL_HB1]